MERQQTALLEFGRANPSLQQECIQLHAVRANLPEYHYFVGNTAPAGATVDQLVEHVKHMRITGSDVIPPVCCIDLAFKLGVTISSSDVMTYNHGQLLGANLRRIFKYSTRERAKWLITRSGTTIDRTLMPLVFDALVGRVDGSVIVDPVADTFLSKNCVDAMVCGFMHRLHERVNETTGRIIADELACGFFATFTDLTNARCDMVDALAAGSATTEIQLQASILNSLCMNPETARCQLADLYPVHYIFVRFAQIAQIGLQRLLNAQECANIKREIMTQFDLAQFDPLASHDTARSDNAKQNFWLPAIRAVGTNFLNSIGTNAAPGTFDSCVDHLLNDPASNAGEIGSTLFRCSTDAEWSESLSADGQLNRLHADFKMTAMAKRLLPDLLRVALCRPRELGAGVAPNPYNRVYGPGYYTAPGRSLEVFRDDDVISGLVTDAAFERDRFPLLQSNLEQFLEPLSPGESHPALSRENLSTYERAREQRFAAADCALSTFVSHCLAADISWSLHVCAFLVMDGVMPDETPATPMQLWRKSMSHSIMALFESAHFGKKLLDRIGGARGGLLSPFLGAPAIESVVLRHRDLDKKDYGTQFITVLVLLTLSETYADWGIDPKKAPVDHIHRSVIAGCLNLPDAISTRIRSAIETAHLQYGLVEISHITTKLAAKRKTNTNIGGR